MLDDGMGLNSCGGNGAFELVLPAGCVDVLKRSMECVDCLASPVNSSSVTDFGCMVQSDQCWVERLGVFRDPPKVRDAPGITTFSRAHTAVSLRASALSLSDGQLLPAPAPVRVEWFVQSHSHLRSSLLSAAPLDVG
jgi:hypothetical protein